MELRDYRGVKHIPGVRPARLNEGLDPVLQAAIDEGEPIDAHAYKHGRVRVRALPEGWRVIEGGKA